MSRKHTAEEYVAALNATGGLVRPAARKLGVTRQAVYKAARTHPAVQEAIDDARADLMDLAQGNIFAEIAAGNVHWSAWLLDRLGRHLGYGKGPRPVTPSDLDPRDLEKLTDAELEARRRALGL